MARTKSSAGAKVATGKSSKARCCAAPAPSVSSSSGSSEKTRSYGGGNTVCPRETPKWQRPITSFFINKPPQQRDGEEACGSSSTTRPKHKRNIIESDDEDNVEIVEKPKNKELDETLELEPLTGEESRKIEEFFPKTGDKNTKNDDNNKINGTNDIDSDNSHENETEDVKGKGKGKGKKSKEKENIDSNTGAERRKSVKRSMEDVTNGEISPQSSKKIKVN